MIYCLAVHVILSFSTSFSLLGFLFLFIGIPKAGWDAKKKNKDKNRNQLDSPLRRWFVQHFDYFTEGFSEMCQDLMQIVKRLGTTWFVPYYNWRYGLLYQGSPPPPRCIMDPRILQFVLWQCQLNCATHTRSACLQVVQNPSTLYIRYPTYVCGRPPKVPGPRINPPPTSPTSPKLWRI